MHERHIAVLYHSKCPDGFGGAYAAWKKFGDAAEYIPVDHGDPPPEGLDGREVYLVDFCYATAEQMKALVKMTGRLVVLDHHQGSKELVESVPEHIYDASRSGATIAWVYFHPDAPTPRLLQYIEDGDLYRFALAETRDIFSYLLVLPFDFAAWDGLASKLDSDAERNGVLQKAGAYTEYFEALANLSIKQAKKVRFEGYEVLFTATHPNITMRSYVGHELYVKLPPFSMVVTAHPNGYGVSLRGDSTVINVAEIAQRYGGGGHPGSAGFFLPNGSAIPWVEIDD